MTLPLWTPVRGLALRGLEEATHVVEGDPGNEYVALGTAAFWAASLDEQLMRSFGADYDAVRDADEQGRVLPGIRLVRNGITHGAVIAVRPAGLSWPLTFPLDWGTSIYGPLGTLLADWIGDRHQNKSVPQQDAVYRAHLEGRELPGPLNAAIGWFTRLERVQWDLDLL
ncbi:hypothetical protein DEJ01_05935 [Curtobacterium sp. MCLR17_040]|uniref:hypothetical protein n=1 Tax=Curtobacterium sp. MCLR17_040 TaxID=2175625 RepID=UPI000DAACF80|nr:hypothetical protein [Curtobacterium sp. MCLR17_040]PZF05557.1 hypothetical protein DEJ01_05935 [Curtobacterium sp. MCLR17_040]